MLKILRVALIVLLMMNIICLVYLIIMPKVKTNSYEELQMEQWRAQYIKNKSNKEKQTNIISFENESILYANYYGVIPTGNVNTKFTELINGGFEKLYTETKGMNNAQLETYLENNKKDIANTTGITKIEDFKNFVKKIQIYKDSELKVEKAEIVEDSYSNDSAYDNFKVRISYENGNNLEFTVYLSNKDFMDTPLIIIL